MARRPKAKEIARPVELPAEPSACTDLDAILGQPRAVGVLRAALRSGRVHHAWVFAGPPGVGKRTTAEAFAAMLLDPTLAASADGELRAALGSDTARLVATRAHPDLHVITKELARFSGDASVRARKMTTIAKEVIETHLLAPIALAPTIRTTALAQKVFIVDEAELMDRSRTNAPTQNALLKTLEEPAPGSVIVLVTAREDALLPTIRSRCQRVGFGPLDDAAMDAWLERANLPAGPEELAWARRLAQGSPGRAELAIETGLVDWARALDPLLDGLDRGRPQPELGGELARLVDAWAADWVKQRPQASKEAANHAGAGHMLGLLAERYRGQLHDVATQGGDPSAALTAIDAIAATERQIAANVPAALAMEHLAAQLMLRA